ncbi:hypothetical protein [Verrucomicrobium sp. BvORR034]|uniref:hypothetical protein n=1 Tax=Verrucomicrobium sp. BvORR034 TaxID=1396418 RepID=UPI0006799400|nr:hypothetical protein [Verrucomicrobium sp. BvORR034]
MTHPEAVQYLAEVHSEFPFAEGRVGKLLADHNGNAASIPPHLWPRSYRVHIGCMVSMACGGLIPKGASRLGFANNANAPRSGKTLLAKMAVAPIYGWTQVRTWPTNDRKRSDEAEIRKALDAVALEATPYIIFDNIKGVVTSEALEGFMTAPVWAGRVLGTNRSFTAEHSTTVVLTGNNLQLSTDNMGRFLLCDLSVEEAEAQDREVKEPIEENWIIDNGRKLKDAVLSLVLHWVGQGRPKCTGRVRRGFEIWSHTVGGILEAAGLGDLFEKRPDDSVSGSPDDADLRRLALELLNRLDLDNRTMGFNFAEIVSTCHEHGILERFLDGKEETEGSGPAQKKVFTLTSAARSRFGNFLKRYAPEKTGRIWHFPPDQEHPYPRTCRLQCSGHDRTREYVAKLEISPQAELQALMHLDHIKWPDLVPILEKNHVPTRLEEISPLDLKALIASWRTLILPYFDELRRNLITPADAQE